MANTRFVPWHSWEEWAFVRDAFTLLSSSSSKSSGSNACIIASSRRSTRRREETLSCEDEKHALPLPLPTPVADDGKEEEEDNEEEDNEEEKNKRRALEIVQMWRVRGRVPLAIDAHAQIVELQLMDEEVMRELSLIHI